MNQTDDKLLPCPSCDAPPVFDTAPNGMWVCMRVRCLQCGRRTNTHKQLIAGKESFSEVKRRTLQDWNGMIRALH